MSNLSILERNILDSLWHEDEELHNEAARVFLRLKEKDVRPYFKAEAAARNWLTAWGLIGNVLDSAEIKKNYSELLNSPHATYGAVEDLYSDVRAFLRTRLENMHFPNTRGA